MLILCHNKFLLNKSLRCLNTFTVINMYEKRECIVCSACFIYLHRGLLCGLSSTLHSVLVKTGYKLMWIKRFLSNHIICRPVLLIGSDSKYPQLNPLTSYQEQDVVDWCWLYTPTYHPTTWLSQPTEPRALMKHGLFYLHCHHPSLFLFARRS